MSRSLVEHLACAPPDVRYSIEFMLRLLVAPPERREAALAELPAELAKSIRDGLPPAGLDDETAKIEIMKIMVEGLGVEHGGTEWLQSMKGKLWTDARPLFDQPQEIT